MVKEKKREIESQEDVTKKVLEKDNNGFDLVKLLNDPVVSSLLGCGKELFKKEKTDPNVCEIYIKAPSEVVLKLFNIKE